MENAITLGVFDSWEVLSDRTIFKKMDKSIFASRESGIPKDIRTFFEVEGLKYGDKKELSVYYNERIFDADIRVDIKNRTKIYWKASLADIINNAFPKALEKFVSGEYNKDFAPLMKFTKFGRLTYRLEFIDTGLGLEAKDELSLPKPELEGLLEGEKLYRVNKYYERNAKNRQDAIKYHGTKCCICGFDFEKIYGKVGQGYIEIHHKTPLYTLDESIVINPKIDLAPVCANCHRMIHRDRDNFKSIEEIKEIIGIMVL
ncbi:hypothetical protein [uncultured Clostridium sp.]|uniref:HNH endonuclease n=1 Tax=uncultured Clostridium sp. TaxID=59620 RepID=UPI00261493CE|nr:hypothetical protein [uncultured Clostridium sp.]